ncbi:hypothetical protein [Actinomadura hibisca]|uniref:hypothetical protein n=1 Tax=Actinomadura hibisca TaxID=68565 RepID=UPI000AC905F1|nr:hypothetical protein [Actinomadura hibisca]
MTPSPSQMIELGMWPEPCPRPVSAPEAVPDAGEFLAVLRAEFPGVGFVADAAAGVWFAVAGKALFVRAATGIELRERLIAEGRRPR